MHSKFLGHQLLALLTDLARQAIELQSSLYTWVSDSGMEEDIDGLTVLVLILSRIRPNFKVDMYAYSRFGLPFLSYHFFGQLFQFTRSKHYSLYLEDSFKMSISGHALFHGLQLLVILVVSGGQYSN
jgi:hypothetical protein